MDSTANILQFCRLCLVKDGVNIPIFDEQGDIRQIYLKISSCLPVKVAREDHLPKKICDGCSNKLDNIYDFWRTSAESEKQLLAWLGATGKDAAQVNVKEEENFDEPLASDISKNDDEENKCYMFEQKVEEGPPVEINDEPPPSKRPRRTAAVKAAIAMDQNSDDDGDSGEPITKMEDDSDETDGDDREPAFVDVPSTSADDQPGPSGVSKDGSDAPTSQSQEKAVCPLCHKSYKTRDKMLRHKRKIHVSKTDEFRCDLCPKVFRQKYKLSSHQYIVHKNKDRYKCDMCSSTFSLAFHLKTHKERFHENSHRFYCKHCKKGFQNQKVLNDHRMVEHGGFRHKCEHCGKAFKNFAYFKLHITTHSEDYVPTKFPCASCDKVFSTRQALNVHKRSHKGNHKTVCDICGKAVTCLRRHLQVHNGEKPHSCEFCEKAFANVSNLIVHKRIHTKEKPYVCDTCSKSFGQRSTLIVHMRYHTGDRPFKCIICSKQFVTRSLLNDHKCRGPDR